LELAFQWRSEARRDRDAGKWPAGSSPAGRIGVVFDPLGGREAAPLPMRAP
jgi:hypothetical protein